VVEVTHFACLKFIPGR